jgi:sugar/nucleoside kinase (ribokinase family)
MVDATRPPCIAVLGTLTRDTTVYADGSRSDNLGGTHYALLTLAHLFDGRARIVPIANVGEDAFEAIHAALALPGIDLSALRRVAQPNNHVYLTYHNAEERDEVLVGLVPPVRVEQCAAVRDVDWMLVNLTSGRDIELATMRALRQRSFAGLQLDVHSLTLGFEVGGRRVLRKPVDWKDWLACADWVQMNETEAALLADGIALDVFARQTLELGPRGVLITLGARGCLGLWRENGSTRTLRLDAARCPEPAYPTGCGDVFGASFAFALLRGAAPEAALRFANTAAGAKAGHEPYTELRRLRSHVKAELARFVPRG